MNSHQIATMTLSACSMMAGLALPAVAQDGSSVMVRRDDSGNTRVMHFSLPNLEALRTPDFTRKDLPIFNEKLVLSEPQSATIGRLIDSYLVAFQALTKDLATVAGPDAEFVPEVEGAQPAAAPAGGPGFGPMAGGAGGPGVNFDDLEGQLPPGSSIGIRVALTASAPGGDGGDDGDGGGGGGEAAAPSGPQADVQVSVDSPGGEEISPELMDKLQKRADALAEQMLKQFQAQQEARAAGAPMPQGPRGGAVRMLDADNIDAHQAELLAKVDEFLEAKARLRATFVVDAQSNLAEEQVARWPALERALTRSRSLPKGRIGGENTDLVKLLADQKFADARMESLTPQVEAYEMALDAALKARDAYLADANQRIDAAISEQKPDKALQIANQSADLRVAVRSVNQQNMEQIVLALGGDEGEAFKAAALKAFYPTVYQRTRGQRLFEAAATIEGVPADIAANIIELRKAYDSELAAMNDQIRQTIDREQPRERQRSLEHLKRTMQGEEQDPHDPRLGTVDEGDPIRAMIEKRADMDDRYIKQVSAMLTPDQVASLPKIRSHKGPIVIHSGGGGTGGASRD